MIVKITGKLVALYNERAIIEYLPFEYETLIPEFTRRQLQSMLQQTISLYTIEYIDGNPTQGRLTPRLLGFLTEVEREFFEIFCSVDGVGAKKAPYYRVVVADSRYPRDGRFIEEIGTYNPMVEPSAIKIDGEKALAWIKNGAQPTDTVKVLLKKAGILE